MFDFKVWKEQISKAKEIYKDAKLKSQQSQHLQPQPQTLRPQFSADVEDVDMNYLQAATSSGMEVRRGSFRGSRISSVAHSHSGSMDLMETGSLPSGFR